MGVTAPVAICLAGGWPPTPSNLRGLDAWIRSEKPAGQPWQWFNPLNTTDRWMAIGTAPYGPGISIFADPATGAMANARTIKGMDGMAGWPEIDASLKRGRLGHDFFTDAGGLLSPVGGSAWGSNPATVESILGNPSPLGGTNNPAVGWDPTKGPSGNIPGPGIGFGSHGFSDPLGFITGINNLIKAWETGLKTFARFAEVTAGFLLMSGGVIVVIAAASGVAEGATTVATRGLVKGATKGATTGDAQARHEQRLAATTRAQEERRVRSSSEGIIERYFRQERQGVISQQRREAETTEREKRASDISDIRLSQWVSAEQQKSWQQFWRGEVRRRQRVKRGEGEGPETILPEIGDVFRGLFGEEEE